MMCQRIGRPPISTIGFGLVSVSSERREPRPPARMTALTPLDAGRSVAASSLIPLTSRDSERCGNAGSNSKFTRSRSIA